MDSTMWPELPTDVLREISGRLGDARYFVRFHAVCKPWRDSHEPTRTARKQWVLPWLLSPDKKIPLKLRCVFTKTNYRALPPPSVGCRRNCVASSDGTGLWYFADRPIPGLVDPLTGAVTLLLPPFQDENRWWEGSPSGVVYSDGSVLLYGLPEHGGVTMFRAALLRPGDSAWMVVERNFRSADLKDIYVSYYRGKILTTVDGPLLTRDGKVGIGDMLAVSRPMMPSEFRRDHIYRHSYMLESRGEILCVSIYVNKNYPEAFGQGLVRALSLSVHALEENKAAPGKILWMRKDGRSLAGRVLFLGRPNSFAVDASGLSGDAGCAYFVYRDGGVMQNRPCCVFRYNLVDDEAKFVERLPREWKNDMCMWLFHQPSIAPTEEIICRLESNKWSKKKQQHMTPTPRSNIYIERSQSECYNTYLSLSVRNIPPGVNNFQLQKFFSKHGKVSDGKVMGNRKNKMPQKVGLVTIAMVQEEPKAALAALSELVYGGCTLQVKLLRSWKRENVPPTGSKQHSRGCGYLICVVMLLFLFVLTVWWKLI